MKEARQREADVRAELTDRREIVGSKRQRGKQIEQQISQLVAEQELDQIDHSKRLPKLREELAQINSDLATWPDVEAELQRRLGAAQADLRQLEYQEALDELEALRAEESVQRRVFMEKALQFLDTAATLRGVLDRKVAIRQGLLEAGRGGLDVGDPEPPVFYAGWVRNVSQGLAEARQAYAKEAGQ